MRAASVAVEAGSSITYVNSTLSSANIVENDATVRPRMRVSGRGIYKDLSRTRDAHNFCIICTKNHGVNVVRILNTSDVCVAAVNKINVAITTCAGGNRNSAAAVVFYN